MPINMHPKNTSTYIPFSLKTLGVVVASVVLCSAAHAAGLGKLTVLSSLGQPLRAEIELASSTREEAGSLVARLAPTEAFRQAKIEFNPVLLSLRFAVEQRGGRQFISMTSTQPINEPFVDVLLELGGNKGRLIREYTFLLDPVDLRLSQNAQVVAPIAVPMPAPVPAPVSTLEEMPAPVNKTVAKERLKATPDTKESTRYKVKAGDTLTQVAARFKPQGVSLDQMLVALYRANPNGFIGDNMNRMRTGYVLSIPDDNTAASASSSSASAVVVAQAADFNAYRNQLAGKVARSTPKMAEATKHSATGKIDAKVEETQAATTESKDKLKLSKADAAADATTGLAGKAAAGSENSIAGEKAVEETTARIKSLEKNISDLQKLLEVKSKTLSEQQRNAQTGNTAVPAISAETVAVAAATPTPAAAVSPSTDVPPVVNPAPVVAEKTPVPTAAVSKKVKAAVAPAPVQASFLDELLDNSLLLPGAGILVALLAALGIYSNRRKKKSNNTFDDSLLAVSNLQTNSLFGSTGGQSVDTNNSVFNSSFAPSASQLDANEVDPIAEADVYIAYGRDAQAEEILKEALRTQPDRHPVRLKLLEIYAGRKDLRSFEMLASELYGMTRGETDEWHQAARLGAALDSNNPLYAGGALSEEVAAKAVALGAPTLPLDELDPEALLTNSQSRTDADSAAFAFDSVKSVMASGFDAVGLSNPVTKQFADAGNSISNVLDFDLGEAVDFTSKSASESDPVAIEDAGGSIDFVTKTVSESKKRESELIPESVIDMPRVVVTTAPVSGLTPLDLGEVDFDFLDSSESKAVESKLSDTDTTPIALPLMENAALNSLHAVDAEMEVEQAKPVSAASTVAGMEFDLSGIDFDFNPDQPSNATTPLEINPTKQFDAAFGDAEMSTKLDLAVAYQEIGDKEGARELLDEVLKDGSSAQIEKAKIMLAELT